MSESGVLTNRKRALIALIHSIVFLGIATHGFVAPKHGTLQGTDSIADFGLTGIYLVVAGILLWLVTLARGLRERAYFLLCAGSAASGLMRTVLGDVVLPPAQYSRVIFLSSAVVIGVLMVRSFPRVDIRSQVGAMPSEAPPE